MLKIFPILLILVNLSTDRSTDAQQASQVLQYGQANHGYLPRHADILVYQPSLGATMYVQAE